MIGKARRKGPRLGARLAILAVGLALATATAGWGPASALAEATEIRLNKGFGITFLPLFVVEAEKLVEKQAAAAGLGDIKTTWTLVDGAAQINDAMLGGLVDVSGNGIPAFLTLWSRTRGTPQEVVGLGGLSGPPMYLNTVNPKVKTLRDFTDNDRIAVTGIKTGLGAVVLQMVVAKEFGADQFAKLDPLTVGMLHPDAYQMIVAGKTEVTAHFASPPFSVLELKLPNVHRVVSSAQVLGNMHLMAVLAPKRFTDANPKLTAAVLAALDEANAIIAKDPRRAAAIYAKAGAVKITEAEVLDMLAADEMNFLATPRGFMGIADFMHKAGTIKVRPAGWKELFIPALHDRPGS